jgi:ribose transport system substrate-binding protein
MTRSTGGFGGRAMLAAMGAALVSAATLTAGGLPAVAAGKSSVTISVVLALSGNEWSTEIMAGANSAAKDLGGKVHLRVTGPPGFDPQRQAQLFLSELETSPDALIVVNVAPPLFTKPALQAEEHGSKVVWINVPPTTEVKDPLFVSSDAFAMGRKGGKIIVAALEKELEKPAAEITGKVAVGICEVGLAVLENRNHGELTYLKKMMPKIDILTPFKSFSDRNRNFALWDQAIRKTPNALTYLDPCEQGEENIPKILTADHIKVPLVSYDTPEEVRDDLAHGTITAAIPANFFMQGYMAVYITGKAMLEGKPLPHGWVKVPTVTIDKSNIAAYREAWAHPDTGLRKFYSKEINHMTAHMPTNLPPADSYNHPKE